MALVVARGTVEVAGDFEAEARHARHLARRCHQPYVDDAEVAQNLRADAVDAQSHGAAGRRPTLFRSPGGHWSPAVLAACAKAGLRPLDWSVDPRDWSRPGVPHIVDVLLTHTRPGSIILDHDGGGDRQQTLDALTIALPRLLDAGYRFTQP